MVTKVRRRRARDRQSLEGGRPVTIVPDVGRIAVLRALTPHATPGKDPNWL